jgi:HAD superfamily hydrolase (TIGR01509 family)
MQNISTVILDLGGVLLNLDYGLTKKAFVDLGISDFDTYYTQFKGSSLFDDLETGRISNKAFFDGLRKLSGVSLTDDQITRAWNAMLLDFPPKRVAFLRQLRGKYRLFLLSNTNDIHYQAFQQSFRKATGLGSLDECFDKAYYSHLMGTRKPEAEAFNRILKEQGLNAGRTLFIDDTAINLEGAKVVGMQTLHLRHPETVESLGL